jgi:hypothetical protein
MANFALTPRSCFLVTEAGLRLLERSVALNGSERPGLVAAVPRWDAGRRTLWYQGKMVKWYRVPAENQETILAAFQEEGWPPRIDDPLGRLTGQDPHQRLHETVKGLNRGQAARLLVFQRDGTGEGVMWAERQG